MTSKQAPEGGMNMLCLLSGERAEEEQNLMLQDKE